MLENKGSRNVLPLFFCNHGIRSLILWFIKGVICLHINFHVEPHGSGVAGAAADNLKKLLNCCEKGDSDITIKLAAHRIRGRRSFITAYGPISAAEITKNAALSAAEAIGAEYAVRCSANVPSIIIEFALNSAAFAAAAKNPKILSDAIYKGILNTATENTGIHTADNPSEFDEYLAANPSKGFIQVQVYSGRSPIPISGAKVTVSKTLSDKYVLSVVYTDKNGRTPTISLPAKPGTMSQTPEGTIPYTTYDILIEKESYLNVTNLNVPIFEGILSIQPVRMNADTGGGGDVYDEKSNYNL